MIDPGDKFWLVWCPTGSRPPSVRHTTFESAQREASRLASVHVGMEFFVVESLGCAVLRPTWLPTDQAAIPF